MKRIFGTALLALVGWTSVGWSQEPCAGGACDSCKKGLGHPCTWGKGVSCYNRPHEEPCTDCDPCGNRHHFCLPWMAAKTDKLLNELHDSHPDCRASAARKLGNRLYTDFCCHPEIVPALVHALQCDDCFLVRKEAAYAIAYQLVANQCGFTALYLASRLDPHWTVRDAAGDALKVLSTQISLGCIREWRKDAEAFEKVIKSKYKPGKESCVEVFPPFCGLCGLPCDHSCGLPVGPLPGLQMAPAAEVIPAPSPAK
jgi:hypothetical protein